MPRKLLARLQARTFVHYKDLEKDVLDKVFESLGSSSPPLHRAELQNTGITTADMYVVLEDLAQSPLKPIKQTGRS